MRKPAEQAPLLRAWAERNAVTLDADVQSGFASDDAFDAVVELIGMLEVLLGCRPSGEPDDAVVRDVEGWILGLNAVDQRTINPALSSRAAAR